MAAPVYSTRFILAGLVNQWVYYTVPPGRRAVIRSITCAHNDGEAARLYARLAGINFWIKDFLANERGLTVDMRVVAYSGETLGIYNAGSDMLSTMSGYLFMETALLRQAEGTFEPGDSGKGPEPHVAPL